MQQAMIGLCKIGENSVRRLRHACHGPSYRLIAKARAFIESRWCRFAGILKS